MYSITQASINDIPELNILINSAYRGEASRQGWTTEADLLDGLRCDEDMLAQMMHTPGLLFLKYVEDGRILGCVRLENHGQHLYLGMLSVSPAMQGKGTGKKLLLAAEEEARRQGCSSIYMTVISARTELIAWYERHGYAQTGQSQPFEAEDPRFGVARMPLEFVVMEKGIS
jgi:ribosomal protein S18 acetylase RimI-like enzyme